VSGWGPQRRRAAVSVTFDNLGEAAALERGEQPGDEPLGRHFSVTRALPRVLGALGEVGLRATFFVEGLNADLYPDTLRGLAADGHEVACHGWRHEPWGGLEPAAERELLERSVERLDGLGLRPLGFRPPGGALTPATPALLRELGFRYCSPAGDTVSQAGGLVVLPFRWPLLDAFHFLPHFGDMRADVLGSAEELSPARLREAVAGALADLARDGGHLTLLFHPFLVQPGERLDAIRAALAGVRSLVDDGTAWCAPCRDVAAAMLR